MLNHRVFLVHFLRHRSDRSLGCARLWPVDHVFAARRSLPARRFGRSSRQVLDRGSRNLAASGGLNLFDRNTAVYNGIVVDRIVVYDRRFIEGRAGS